MTTNTLNGKPLKLIPKDRILTDILTLAIILTVMGAICIFIAPEYMENDKNVIPIHTALRESDNTPVMNDSLVITFMSQENTEIEKVMKDIISITPINETQYYSLDMTTYAYINTAVNQAEFIYNKYNYTVGVVIMWNKHTGNDYAQTWVNINGTRYVIDSASYHYWLVDKHNTQYNNKYKIQFMNMEKGLELAKFNNEKLNKGWN